MPPTITTKSEQTVGIVPPPPGVTPNFDHPASSGRPAVILNIIFLLLSTSVLFLRMYTRWFIVHLMNASDYAIIMGQLLGIGFSTINFLLIGNNGVAVHAWDIPLSKIGYILKLSILQAIFVWLAIMCAKVSILLLYLRLSPYKHFRTITYGLITVVIVYGFIGCFEFLFACQPIAKYWDRTITYGSCIDQSKFWISNAAVNSVTDTIMVFLPIFMLWHVHVPPKQKIGLIAVFMTGVFVCATSFIRLHYQVKLSSATDVSWKASETTSWSTVEVFVGLICASLPHAKPFLRHHFPKLLGSTDYGSGNLSARRTKGSTQAPSTALPRNDGDEVWLCRGGNGADEGIPLPPFNSSKKSSNNDLVSAAKEDQPVTITMRAGKSTSQGDEDSQRAILEVEAIEAASDINVEEEYPHSHHGY